MEKYKYNDSIKTVRRSFENVSSIVPSRSFDGSKEPRVLPINYVSNSNKIKNFNFYTIRKSESNLKDIQGINFDTSSINIPIQKSHENFEFAINKKENNFLPPLPIDKYPISKEPFSVVNVKPKEPINYVQNIKIRYLEPPEAEKPGDLIIRQLPNRQIAPAPPLVITQTPPRPITPPPLYIREFPPEPPQKVETKIINVPGKVLPPPQRQLIIEKHPSLPPKPQTIIIDKWLPYKQQPRNVIYEKLNFNEQKIDETPKNKLIIWDSPNVKIERQVSNLGVYQTDPNEYIRQYNEELKKSNELKKVLDSIPKPVEFNAHQLKKSYYQSDFKTLKYTENVNITENVTSKKKVTFV